MSATSLPVLFSAILKKNQKLSGYILLTDKISLSGCFYSVKYWAICALKLFVNQAVTS